MVSVDAQPLMRASASGSTLTRDGAMVARRGVRTARQIREDIAAGGSPAGAVFGSQNDLRQRYKVGDEALGVAVRILEFNGIARMRSGRGGGLVVCRPPIELVVASIIGHLHDWRKEEGVGNRIALVNAARASLTVAIARSAVSGTAGPKSAEGASAQLSGAVQRTLPLDPAVILADVFGDTCLHLAARSLHSLFSVLQSVGGSVPAPYTAIDDDAAKRQLAEFVEHCGLDGADERALTLVDRFSRHSPGDNWPANPFLSYESPLNRSRVGQVVRTIATEMKAGVLSDHIGSEGALGERYKVSRSTIRQALYVLEDAEIVTARRGRHNGWFACAQSPALAFRQVQTYLARFLVQPATAQRSVEAWRRAALEFEPNPVVDFLLRALEAYAAGRG